MRIQFISDLHLEFLDNEKYIRKVMTPVECDFMVIGGDLHLLTVYKKINWFLDWLSSKYKQVFIVPGNHEYYCSFDMADSAQSYEYELRSNVHIVNNIAKIIDDKQFLFSTLWSKVYPDKAPKIRKGMRDFSVCNFQGERLTIETYNTLHTICSSFIRTKLNENHLPTYIFTHHAPSFRLMDDQYIGSGLNQAFYTDLDEIFDEFPQIKNWVYGHTHSSKEVTIGNAQILTNQLGYLFSREETRFLWDRCIEI